MSTFAPALAHGAITEIFDNVFSVTGGFRFAAGFMITRNMTIVRQGDELVLLNSVRLTPEGEAALDKLGKVAHVVRVGAFHGLDDPYFVERYKPTLWGPPGIKHRQGLMGKDLREGECPLPGTSVFTFAKGKHAECAMLLPHDGGALVTCDAYQNWTTFQGCSLLGKIVMPTMGFGPTLIGKPWLQAMGPDVRSDFDRLIDVPFRHLVPGHGSVLRDTAREGLRTAMKKRFGS